VRQLRTITCKRQAMEKKHQEKTSPLPILAGENALAQAMRARTAIKKQLVILSQIFNSEMLQPTHEVVEQVRSSPIGI